MSLDGRGHDFYSSVIVCLDGSESDCIFTVHLDAGECESHGE